MSYLTVSVAIMNGISFKGKLQTSLTEVEIVDFVIIMPLCYRAYRYGRSVSGTQYVRVNK